MTSTIRPLQLPEDYEGIARLLNSYWPEPTTAERLMEDDAKMYTEGHTYLNADGLLAGYDRTRRVAVTAAGEIVGYLLSWRAPWTEPGQINNTLIVMKSYRRQGVGQLLARHAALWSQGLGAKRLVSEIWDDCEDSLRFARHQGFTVERHTYQSVLPMEHFDRSSFGGVELFRKLEGRGLRFTTLKDEFTPQNEEKLYELYKETLVDIPGFHEEVPPIREWRTWLLEVDGYAPDQVLIAADRDRYIGVTNVLYNPSTKGMYHEYTGVSRKYRGQGIGLALKLKAIQLAKQRGAVYIRTDNDSLNEPILRINSQLGYKPLRGQYKITANIEDIVRCSS
ncbi:MULTISPECIES: GNAT family N-acetyltransferase [unclassified Paenibacillus]|uniref:GNAT family N-acetyltransferase n=1 Tax=unclassified Paenibacillus TaxID=185978 RepID=UPI001595FBDB|nr:GNAT family N-acetyltransferase [Paenibacillus sp. 7541]